MDKIGNILKQKRLEYGLTIEEISDKTRLTIKHIKAIEEGDITYFKDDLSYLRFFLKAYCDVLSLDFEEMKEELQLSIDDYTSTFSANAIRQHEAIERGVKENAEKMKKDTPKKSKKKIKKKVKAKKVRRRKLDMSLLSFLAIVVVLLIGLIFAFVMWVQGSKNAPSDLVDNKPPVATPSYSNQPTQKPSDSSQSNEQTPGKNDEKDKKEMVITKVNDTPQYTIENVDEDQELDIEIIFGSNSSFRALVDDKQLTDPAQQIYLYKKELHVREKAVKGKKIQLAFGWMQGNTIKVNGVELELPESVRSKAGSVIVQLDVKGE